VEDGVRGDTMRLPLWLAALLAVLGLLLAACPETGPDPDVPDDEEPAAVDPPDDEPVRGGTLRVALSADPGHLNPAITTAGAVHFATHLLYNGLVDLDDDLEPVPELAADWRIEDDGATYVFHLRDDVFWHDGVPFTSADVKFSFENVLLELNARTAGLAAILESIETPDEHTVVFRFTDPYAPFLRQLDVGEAPIVPRHVFEGDDLPEHPANVEPVGTGPFRFVSYAPDSEIVYERNESYWRDDLPHLDRIVMRIIPEAASQVIALEAGEIDWVWRVPGPDVGRLAESADVELMETFRASGAVNCPMTLTFNLDRPALQDVDVRRAVAHAINREQFVERILFGQGVVPQAPFHSATWAHAPEVDLPGFDPEESRRLLEDAGWVEEDGRLVADGVEGVPDGSPFEIDFVHFPTFAEYGELLRAQLRDIGIEVELRVLEPPVFVPTVFEERDFDTNIISFCQGPDPEIGMRRQFHSSQIGPVPFSNAAGYANDRADELSDLARTTIDEDDRRAYYRELQEILAEDLPYFWITEPLFTVAHAAECRAFKPYSHYAEEAFCRR
jgi:peptide/nickel transport system substrate-binding protein